MSTRHGLLLPVFASIVLSAFATPIHAQVWNEAADAGDLVASAQATIGTGSLTQINGTLSSPFDVDVYCIKAGPGIVIFGVPVVALQCQVNQGPNVYVFDPNSIGVSTNETCQSGVKQLTNGTLPVVSGSTTLYVAVAHYGNEPVTGAGTIWQLGLPGERTPDGTDPASPLTGWSGAVAAQPVTPYTIAFAPNGGVVVEFCDAPVDVDDLGWGALKARFE